MSIDGHGGGFSVSALAAHRGVAVDSVDADEDSDVESDDDDERHDAVRDEFQVLEDVRREHRSIVFATGAYANSSVFAELNSPLCQTHGQSYTLFSIGPVTSKIATSSGRPELLPNT